jgi:hypothetical protein
MKSAQPPRHSPTRRQRNAIWRRGLGKSVQSAIQMNAAGDAIEEDGHVVCLNQLLVQRFERLSNNWPFFLRALFEQAFGRNSKFRM